MTSTISAIHADPSALPQELFRHVLLNLSPPQIARCRAVCKSWRDQIDKGKFPIDFDRPKRLWALLHQPPITIPLPPHLQINPVNILPLGKRWVVEDANSNCHILPDEYLGEGRIYPFGKKVLFAKEDRLLIYNDNNQPPLEIQARSWSIGDERLLVIWQNQARLFDANGIELLCVDEVTSAQCVGDILVTYHPGRTIQIFNINGARSTKTDIGNVVLTKMGVLVYESGDQLFYNGNPICELEQDRLLAANDEVAFLGHLQGAYLREVFLQSQATAEIPVSSDWLKARIAPDSWEEELHLLNANIRHIRGCTIFTTHKEQAPDLKSTTLVIRKATDSPPLKFESSGCFSPLLEQDCVWGIDESEVVVFDSKALYTLHSKRFEGRSFFSDGRLVSVDGRYAYIRTVRG